MLNTTNTAVFPSNFDTAAMLAKMNELAQKFAAMLDEENKKSVQYPCSICGSITEYDLADVWVCEHVYEALKNVTAPANPLSSAVWPLGLRVHVRTITTKEPHQ